jgi:hypothetical protein
VGVLWRLLGQLVAVETLVFVILRPKMLQRLHMLLAGKAVSLSAALHRLGLISDQLQPGGSSGTQRSAFAVRSCAWCSHTAPRACSKCTRFLTLPH